MGYNYQHRGTNSKTHSRSGFQYADWLIQVLIEIVTILVKWTAIHFIMKKTNNPASVVISSVTAEAICKLLYSENGGVDMSPIVEDLGGTIVHKLNVGLLMKGLKPEVDTRTRMYYRDDSGYRCVFVNYSLLLDRVNYVIQRRCSDGSWNESWSNNNCSLAEWEDKEIWEEPTPENSEESNE